MEASIHFRHKKALLDRMESGSLDGAWDIFDTGQGNFQIQRDDECEKLRKKFLKNYQHCPLVAPYVRAELVYAVETIQVG